MHGLISQHLTLWHRTEKLLILRVLNCGSPPGCPGSALAPRSKKLGGGKGKGQAFLHSQTFPKYFFRVLLSELPQEAPAEQHPNCCREPPCPEASSQGLRRQSRGQSRGQSQTGGAGVLGIPSPVWVWRHIRLCTQHLGHELPAAVMPPY